MKHLAEAQQKMRDKIAMHKPCVRRMNKLAEFFGSPNRQLLIDILSISKEVRCYINYRWINLTIAWQIRGMRKHRGWTQQELANRAGLTVITIVRIEKFYWGKSDPTLTTLKKIADAFDVALLARFAPWSQLVNDICSTPHVDKGLGPEDFNIPNFEEELAADSFKIEELQ